MWDLSECFHCFHSRGRGEDGGVRYVSECFHCFHCFHSRGGGGGRHGISHSECVCVEGGWGLGECLDLVIGGLGPPISPYYVKWFYNSIWDDLFLLFLAI